MSETAAMPYVLKEAELIDNGFDRGEFLVRSPIGERRNDAVIEQLTDCAATHVRVETSEDGNVRARVADPLTLQIERWSEDPDRYLHVRVVG